jgi:hypothetical protein
MKKIEIQLSKTKIILLFLGGLLFLVLGILFTINSENYVSPTRSIEFIKIVGVTTIVFTIMSLIYALVKLFDNKLGLIIDANGITDNSSGISVGLIFWEDIVSISTTNVKSTQFLLLNVKNPESYVPKVSNIKRFLIRANLKMYGTPICISSVSLKINFEELKNIIESEFQKNKQ